MANNNFWEEGDVSLMKAWVADLQSIGYIFPVPRRAPNPVDIVPASLNHPTPKHWCGNPIFPSAFPGCLTLAAHPIQHYKWCRAMIAITIEIKRACVRLQRIDSWAALRG